MASPTQAFIKRKENQKDDFPLQTKNIGQHLPSPTILWALGKSTIPDKIKGLTKKLWE